MPTDVTTTPHAFALSIWLGVLGVVGYLSIVYLFTGRSGGITGMVAGQDGRLSTSKFQFFVWTAIVVFSYIALFVWKSTLHCAEAAVANCGSLQQLPTNVLIAMGFSVITMATAKGITTSYVAAGRLLKDQNTKDPGISDLVIGDLGKPDLSKIQMLTWTAIAIAVYLYQVVSLLPTFTAKKPFPDIDETLMILMGIGQGAYLGTKLATSTTAKLLSITPATAPVGATAAINGQGFGATGGTVQFGDVVAASSSWSDTAVAFTVPPRKNDGTPFISGNTVYVGLVLQGTQDQSPTTNTVPFTVQ